MGQRLPDQVAIVTGAGSVGPGWGNGKATAVLFAREGARLFAVDINLAAAEETREIIIAEGGQCTAHRADVSQSADVAAMVERCLATYGRIDILHNNVGIGTNDCGPTKITETIWDEIFAVNLKSVMFTCKHALQVMRQQQFGSIINISSIAAVCNIGLVSYKASKAALNAYTHTLATGGAKFGIRANVIMPGLMDTPMAIEGYVAAGHDRAALIKRRNDSVPLGRQMGTAWDIANAAVFLASDASAYMTGHDLVIDGGYTLW